MLRPTFTPPVNPSFPLDVKTSVRVRTVKFGDGYAQHSPDGLNAMESKVTLNWDNLTRTEKDQIVGFMAARLGSEPFDYEVDGDSYVLIAQSWSHEKTTANAYNLQVECEVSHQPV